MSSDFGIAPNINNRVDLTAKAEVPNLQESSTPRPVHHIHGGPTSHLAAG